MKAPAAGVAAAVAAPHSGRGSATATSGANVVSAIGLLAWIVALLVLPMTASLQGRILLLAPLVVVPRLLDVLPTHAWSTTRLVPSGLVGLLAALPLLGSFALPAGPLAAALAIPWLAFAAGLVAAARLHGLRQLPGLLHPARASELAGLVCCGFPRGRSHLHPGRWHWRSERPSWTSRSWFGRMGP